MLSWLNEVVLCEIRLCELYQRLVQLTRQERVLPGLVHRGGLRAQVVRDGIIRVSDAIEVLNL